MDKNATLRRWRAIAAILQEADRLKVIRRGLNEILDDEELPCETIFFRHKNAISEETMAWAQSVVDEYEESLARKESNAQDPRRTQIH
jgi:hypothetical protein